MKAALLLLLIFANQKVLAQSSSAPLEPAESSAPVSTGFRVSLLKPSLTVQNPSENSNSQLENSLGISLGYIDMPIDDFGWSASFAYLSGETARLATGLQRLDMNVGYALNRIFSLRGGFNLSTISRQGFARLTPSGGLQLIASAQIHRNLSIDVGYLNMNQGLPENLKVLNESGLELGVAGTF